MLVDVLINLMSFLNKSIKNPFWPLFLNGSAYVEMYITC